MTDQKVQVKICGIMDVGTALAGALAEADFLGLIFVAGVRRQISPENGTRIIENFRNLVPESVKFVGVFRNQDFGWVNEVSATIGADAVQLCGDEDEQYMDQVKLPLLRQIRIRETHTADEIENEVMRHTYAGRLVVLESFHPSTPGGSGIAWDWGKVRGIASIEGVFLGGGLSSENVRLAISSASPWGVDVSTGVEKNGMKSPDKITDFIHATRTTHAP